MYQALGSWTDIFRDVLKAVPGVITAASGGYSTPVYNPATGISYPAPAPAGGYRDPRIVGYDTAGRPLYAADADEGSGSYTLPLVIGAGVLLLVMMRRR